MYSEQEARKAIAFIEALKHTKGIWRGVNFELLPWQRQIIGDVFGTLKAMVIDNTIRRMLKYLKRMVNQK